jgi:glycerol kinase
MKEYILVLDQGSSSSRTLVYDKKGNICFNSNVKVNIKYSGAANADYDATELLKSQLKSLDEVLSALPSSSKVIGLGIATQRSTIILFDSKTGKPLCRALSWQDGRGIEILKGIKIPQAKIHEITGLYKTPYYSASKIAWCMDNYSSVRQAHKKSRLMVSSVAGYILWHLSKGRISAMDATLAQRTLLFDIKNKKWHSPLLKDFKTPKSILPSIMPTIADYGTIERKGFSIPVYVMVGDQQAALIGLGIKEKMAALNYGTGAFLLVNTGKKIVKVQGLLNSIGAVNGLKKNDTFYITESTVNAAATALQWLKKNFNLFEDISDIDKMCKKSSNRLFVLPAIGGIGSPYWDFSTFTTFTGLSAKSTKYDIIRGFIEGICFMIADAAMLIEDSGTKISSIIATGGLSQIDYLLQFQADITGAKIIRSPQTEGTAFGTAKMTAGALKLSTAKWKSNKSEKVFSPQINKSQRDKLIKSWRVFLQDSQRMSGNLRKAEVLPHQ